MYIGRLVRRRMRHTTAPGWASSSRFPPSCSSSLSSSPRSPPRFCFPLPAGKGSTFSELRPAGLSNFAALFTDPVFFRSLVNTLIFVAATTVFLNVLGFLCASLVDLKIGGSSFFKNAIFLPVLLAPIIIGDHVVADAGRVRDRQPVAELKDKALAPYRGLKRGSGCDRLGPDPGVEDDFHVAIDTGEIPVQIRLLRLTPG